MIPVNERRQRSRLVVGLLFIAFGVAALLQNLGVVQADLVQTWWPLVFVALGVGRIVQRPGAHAVIFSLGLVVLGYAAGGRQIVTSAADYGSAQRRTRLVFLGSRDGEDLRLPSPTHDQHARNGLSPWRTLREALEDLDEAVAAAPGMRQRPTTRSATRTAISRFSSLWRAPR